MQTGGLELSLPLQQPEMCKSGLSAWQRAFLEHRHSANEDTYYNRTLRFNHYHY
jgi:hypothetical protein